MDWTNFKKSKKVAYVVFVGRIPGIYETWEECNAQVHGYPGARFKGYTIYEDAIKVWDEFEELGKIAVKQPGPKQGKKEFRPRTHKRVDPAITARARRLVNASKEVDGSNMTTCTSANCTYPACNC